VKAWLAAALLALPLLAQAVPAREPDEAVLATKAAMDAFFSLPDAAPDGVTSRGAPAGFDPATGQPGLTQFLEVQRLRGARWDRYRYLGTLLHHSLRADFDEVTQWLLDHGADPRQRIENGASGELDALGVAVRMERWPFVTTLLRHPAYRRMPAAEVAARLWAGAATPSQRAGLLRLRPAVPMPAVSTAAGAGLLVEALCGADRSVVARLAAGGASPVTPAPQPTCAQLETPQAQRLDLKAWLALEPHFTQPLLPYLIAVARNGADLRALLSAGFRQPWDDDKFVQAVIARVPKGLLPELLLSKSAWGAPVDRLWSQVTLHQAVELWRLPRARWEALLQSATPVALNQLMNAGVWAVFGREFPDHWEPLVTRLDALTPAQRPVTAYVEQLLGEVTPAQFSRVLAWLVAADRVPEALPKWLYRTSAKGLELSWPALKRQAPQWADQVLAVLLVPLLAEPPTDRLGKGMLAYGVGDDGLAKARFLRGQGLKAPPRLLAASNAPAAMQEIGAPGCCGVDLARWAVRERLLLLPKGAQMAPNVPAAPVMQAQASAPTAAVPAERLALVAAPPDCLADVSPGLRKALAGWTQAEVPGDEDAPRLEGGWLQPVAAPGERHCQWMRSWIEITGGGWTERSFFGGEQYQSHRGTIEEKLTVEFWDGRQSAFAGWHKLFDSTGLVEVELLPRGDRFWLSLDSHANGDRPAEAMALAWQDGRPKLDRLPQTSPLHARWQAVVDPRRASEALGLADPDGETASTDRLRGPREPRGVAAFADAHWAAEKAAFLAAFAALDRSTLARAQQAGLFAHWLDAAVIALGADEQMPLDARRARMAWLLATPAQANALSAEALKSLAPWLPAQDWWPITEPRRCSRAYPPRLEVGEQASPAVVRRIAVERARDCNGVVR
jgi:hypothetical protein